MKNNQLSKLKGPSSKRYSLAFKLQVVREYEQGVLTRTQLRKKYGIGGNSQILDWLRKYGKLTYQSTGHSGAPMKDPQKQRIKELEHKLKEATVRASLYEKMIDIAEEETGIDIRKKFGAEQSKAPTTNTK